MIIQRRVRRVSHIVGRCTLQLENVLLVYAKVPIFTMAALNMHSRHSYFLRLRFIAEPGAVYCGSTSLILLLQPRSFLSLSVSFLSPPSSCSSSFFIVEGRRERRVAWKTLCWSRMALSLRLRLVLCLGLLGLLSVSGLYEDEVGELDWHVSNVGAPTQAVFKGKYLILGTSAGVVAALSAETGEIRWRNPIPDGNPKQIVTSVHP